MTADIPPITRSQDGSQYLCALCGTVIPDGAIVQANWDSNGGLVGVRVIKPGDPDATPVHECGTIGGLVAKWDGQTNG